MTPKEEAKELFIKFSGNTVHYESAKQCALIVADRIISELEDIMNFTGNKLSSGMIKYWQEVKQEIEKL